MKIFGDRSVFSLEYELKPYIELTEFNSCVNKKSLSQFIRRGKLCTFKGDISDLVEWFEDNLYYILNENDFPFPTHAKTGIDFSNTKSSSLPDGVDFDEFYEDLEKWNSKHCWYAASAGAISSDACFRKVGKKIEISWDSSNMNHFEELTFINSAGISYIDIEYFNNVVLSFVNSFKYDINNLKKQNLYLIE